MRPSRFLNKTKDLLATRSRTCTYKNIEDATGIPATWLKNLARGRIADPGVRRIETLYEFFTGKPLRLS